MIFNREPYNSMLIAEMMPLWEAHHKEIQAFDVPLDPDLETYKRSDESGTLRIYTAREAGVLLGYQVFFVLHHPHSKKSIQAIQDVLFLDADYRRGLNGYRFIRWCVEELRKEGVQIMYQHISADHDFGVMLERMGFKHVDQVYGKELTQVEA